jgi:hypothetical protein
MSGPDLSDTTLEVVTAISRFRGQFAGSTRYPHGASRGTLDLMKITAQAHRDYLHDSQHAGREAFATVRLLTRSAPRSASKRNDAPSYSARCFTCAATARSGPVRRGRRRDPHAVARAALLQQLDTTEVRGRRSFFSVRLAPAPTTPRSGPPRVPYARAAVAPQ